MKPATILYNKFYIPIRTTQQIYATSNHCVHFTLQMLPPVRPSVFINGVVDLLTMVMHRRKKNKILFSFYYNPFFNIVKRKECLGQTQLISCFHIIPGHISDGQDQ